MQRHCPRDRTLLVERKLEGVTVDECPKCGGAFFDENELGRATGDKELARYLSTIHGAASSPMVCPACGNLMDLDKVDEVELDHCTSYLGVWLDKGEMERLGARGEDALHAGKEAKARSAEEQRFREAPRGGAAGGRFAALGEAFRNIAWKLKRKREAAHAKPPSARLAVRWLHEALSHAPARRAAADARRLDRRRVRLGADVRHAGLARAGARALAPVSQPSSAAPIFSHVGQSRIVPRSAPMALSMALVE